MVGLAHLDGTAGTHKDVNQAYMWLWLACAQGDPDAAKELHILEQSMTPAQIHKNTQRAKEWQPTPRSKLDTNDAAPHLMTPATM